MLLLQEAQVQSLDEILGFYMPCGAAKKKIRGKTKKPDEQKNNKKTQISSCQKWGSWVKWVKDVRSYKIRYKMTSHGNIVDGMVAVVNNTVVHIWKSLKE